MEMETWQEFEEKFGMELSAEMIEFLDGKIQEEYDAGYADGQDASDEYSYGYDEGYKDGLQDGKDGVEQD